MGYRGLVQQQVRKAFSAVKDLAVDVTLVEKVATDFSFSSKTATTSTPVTKVIKGIVLEQAAPSVKIADAVLSTTLKMKILLQSADISSLDIYDKATIAGAIWNIVPPSIDNGFTCEVNLAREA